MTDNDQPRVIRITDPPTEVDCECGTHHVLDPVAIDKFLRHRMFRCFDCRKVRSMRRIAGIAIDGRGIAGVCQLCTGRYR
jgi:hypothetical protein